MSRTWAIVAIVAMILAIVAASSCTGGCRLSDAQAWLFGDADKTMNVFTFALVALAVIQIAEARRVAREHAAENVDALARALHVELSEFVARCCFDFESPWGRYLHETHDVGEKMDHFRLNKFVPGSPIIYEATANQISRLNDTAPQSLIQFYYRVAAWRRDALNMANDLRMINTPPLAGTVAPPTLSKKDARFLAQRLRETLAPGLKALMALGEMVEKPEETEDAAVEAHDKVSRRGLIVPEKSLRKRIVLLLAE